MLIYLQCWDVFGVSGLLANRYEKLMDTREKYLLYVLTQTLSVDVSFRGRGLKRKGRVM